jgi:PAS domain S-box-containing protein
MKSIRKFIHQNQKISALVLASAMVLIIGIIDSLAGTEISLSAFYLIPIFLGTYYGGFPAGVFISIASILIYLIGDKILSIQYSRSAIPYWNAGVRFLLFAAVTYAIAKRRIAEQRLAQSEERFRLLVEGAKEYAILMLNEDGRIENWNLGAQRIYGYRADEIVGKHFASLYNTEEAQAGKPTDDLILARQNGDISFEGWCRKKDNQNFWADLIITAVGNEHKSKRAFALLTRDITERKKAEKTIQLFAELHEVDRAILATNSADAIANEALKRIQKLIPYQFATVTRFDEESGQSFFLTSKSIDEIEHTLLPFLLEGPDYDDLERLKQGEVYCVEDTYGSSRAPLHSVLPFPKLRSYIIVPLLSQSTLIGSVNLGAHDAYTFTSENVDVAREVANQLALALRNADLFEKLKSANQRLQLLSQKLLQAQETEKRNLARELHDEMGQALTALKIHLEGIDASHQDAALSKKIRESIAVVDRILNEIRNLSLNLRPLMLDDLGLEAALRWYASTRAQLGGFSLHFDSSRGDVPFSSEIETACFRVAQEALTNIVRHASAKHVRIELVGLDDRILLSIKDDGKGFDVQEAQTQTLNGESFGLLGMRERVLLAGGDLEIESVPNCGTEIRVRLPLQQKEAPV